MLQVWIIFGPYSKKEKKKNQCYPGLVKKFIQVFHKKIQKNLKEAFDQSSIFKIDQ